jgi:hypothetical protein
MVRPPGACPRGPVCRGSVPPWASSPSPRPGSWRRGPTARTSLTRSASSASPTARLRHMCPPRCPHPWLLLRRPGPRAPSHAGARGRDRSGRRRLGVGGRWSDPRQHRGPGSRFLPGRHATPQRGRHRAPCGGRRRPAVDVHRPGLRRSAGNRAPLWPTARDGRRPRAQTSTGVSAGSDGSARPRCRRRGRWDPPSGLLPVGGDARARPWPPRPTTNRASPLPGPAGRRCGRSASERRSPRRTGPGPTGRRWRQDETDRSLRT